MTQDCDALSGHFTVSYRWHPGFVFALFAWSNAASADGLPAAGAVALGAAATTTRADLLFGSKSDPTVNSSTSSQLAGTNGSPASDVSGGDGNGAGGITSRGAAAGADSANPGVTLSPGGAAGTYYVNGAGTVTFGGS